MYFYATPRADWHGRALGGCRLNRVSFDLSSLRLSLQRPVCALIWYLAETSSAVSRVHPPVASNLSRKLASITVMRATVRDLVVCCMAFVTHPGYSDGLSRAQMATLLSLRQSARAWVMSYGQLAARGALTKHIRKEWKLLALMRSSWTFHAAGARGSSSRWSGASARVSPRRRRVVSPLAGSRAAEAAARGAVVTALCWKRRCRRRPAIWDGHPRSLHHSPPWSAAV